MIINMNGGTSEEKLFSDIITGQLTQATTALLTEDGEIIATESSEQLAAEYNF